MHTKLTPLALAILLASQNSYGQDKVSQKDETDIEKLIITATPLGRSALESTTPVSVLGGEELEKNHAATLGETLKSVPGVNSSYFGPVASSPIIRGLDGPRVKIVQNNMDVSDASRVGPDHATTVETTTATQIEVLRGPSTLLYGSGAIGGVINIVDNRLPNTRQEGVSGKVNAFYDSVSDERTASTELNGGQGNFAWHVDGFSRQTNDYDVPEFIVDEEDGDTADSIENSFIDANGFTLGAGWIGDDLNISLSFAKLQSDYGVPGHSHGHHDEEHEDEHEGEDHHDEDEHDEEEHDELEELVYAQLDQERFQSVIDWKNLTGFFSEVHWHNAYTDYQHHEIEGDAIGSTFENDTFESRLWAKHQAISGWVGVLGAHYSKSDFSAQGEEAFTPSTTTQSSAVFLLEEKEIGNLLWQFGSRVEQVSHKPDNEFFHEQSNIQFDELNFTALSLSTGFVYKFEKDQSLAVNLARSERAPSAAEIYSNGIHISTSTYEVGAGFELELDESEPDHISFNLVQAESKVDKEVSTNIDISYRVQTDDLHASFSVFYNQIDNYLYQQNTGLEFEDEHDEDHDEHDEDHDEHDEDHDEHDEDHDEHDEDHDEHGEDHDEHDEDALAVFKFTQNDADLYGFEAQLDWHINDQFRLSTFSDYTRAKLSGGQKSDLPRIPPLRVGFELHWEKNNWHGEVGVTQYAKQKRIAEFETVTDDYAIVSANLNYYMSLPQADLTFYLKGNNLTNKLARVHTSFLKEQAPLPGRSLLVGIKAKF